MVDREIGYRRSRLPRGFTFLEGSGFRVGGQLRLEDHLRLHGPA
jgi:hypothetical protein